MLLLIYALLFTFGLQVSCLTHQRTLMWTLKSVADGSVDVRGIPGDPEDWVFNGITEYSNSYFTDNFTKHTSRRVALAFQYSNQAVFFNDKGFKEIFKITLQAIAASNTTRTFNVSIEVVYGGISTEVNGLAMDWVSGSLYWTDALYNWITVANASDYNVAKHIIHTGFSRPMGLTVYPKRGLMFWSVVGAVPKIERATLGGLSRMNFVDGDIDRPLGLSIDYKNDQLYWIDDLRDTVECVDLDNPTNRRTMHVGYRHSLTAKLFGLAVYNDFIFVTDQLYMTIDVYNKTTESFIMNFTASVVERLPKGIPYDIQMYDASIQQEIDSDCNRLRCSDICISDGDRKAHCICQEGYTLSLSDARTCIENATFRMPQYLYSVGENLCGTDVTAADQEYVPTDIRYFYNISGHEMVALGFDAYAGFLFFSDAKDRVIHRMILTNSISPSSVEIIIANTGNVSGIAVDWIADNLYWTDEEHGLLMVSRLTGRYPKVLLQNLQSPKSIALNPLKGAMYWATSDTIYTANMDGTEPKVLIHLSGSDFDGMVLDIRRDLLYWVDQSLPGIWSCHMNGSGLTVVLKADVTSAWRTFRDVTVYENYLAWTDGQNSVYFGVTSQGNSSLVNILKGLQHVNEKTSHDIITYDTYLQPLPEPGKMNPCDIDNDLLGCSQLCLLTRTGRQCACSAGFDLINDNFCASEPLVDNFLLFVDPYHKSVYQYDLRPSFERGIDSPRLRGIALQSANLPSLVAFDCHTQNLFWFDEDRLKNSIKRISIQETVHYHTIVTLSKDLALRRIDTVDRGTRILYADSSSGSAFTVSVETGDTQQLSALSNVYGAAVAVDDDNGDIYWVNGATNGLYKCHLNSSCLASSAHTTVMESWTGNRIAGLNLALNDERNLILWTENEVYLLISGSPKLVFIADDFFNLTAVVVVEKTIYYASSVHNSVFEYDMETKFRNVTVDGFSRIADLKVFCPSFRNVSAPAESVGLGIGPKIGIAIGCVLFLLLLILLIVCLVILIRRREKETTPTVAYTNPTYARLSSVVSTLSSLSDGAEVINPYDVLDNNHNDKKELPFPQVYDDEPPLYFADEASGATGYNYFVKEPAQEGNKKGLPFPEVSVVDPPPIYTINGADSASQDAKDSSTAPSHASSTAAPFEDTTMGADDSDSARF